MSFRWALVRLCIHRVDGILGSCAVSHGLGECEELAEQANLLDMVVQAQVSGVRFARQTSSAEVLKVEVEDLGLDLRKLESPISIGFDMLLQIDGALGKDSLVNDEGLAQITAADNDLDDYVAEPAQR